MVMGASETVLEDVQFDEKGHILNPNLHGYLMMTIKDAPEVFSGLVDSYEPEGPFGAKEIGEGGPIPKLDLRPVVWSLRISYPDHVDLESIEPHPRPLVVPLPA